MRASASSAAPSCRSARSRSRLANGASVACTSRSPGTSVRQSSDAATSQTTVRVPTPMRVAVISDIHANLHALEAVLAEIDARRPTRCGASATSSATAPRPNECCAIVASAPTSASSATTTSSRSADRHRGLQPRGGRPRRAGRDAPRRPTRAPSSSRSAERRRRARPALPRERARPGLGVRPHRRGGARDAPADDRAGRARRPQPRRARAHALDGTRLGRARARPATEDPRGTRWLLNPGSVGPAAGRRPARAAWLLLDFDARFASFRRVAYPIEGTQSEMREAGLPEPLAARLAVWVNDERGRKWPS